ncbi:MAG TPA: putative glycoside hydrolase [Longimicrobiales bacterium]|nr:putative glycoside hydrolase [Longimicrobiales bacterium]
MAILPRRRLVPAVLLLGALAACSGEADRDDGGAAVPDLAVIPEAADGGSVGGAGGGTGAGPTDGYAMEGEDVAAATFRSGEGADTAVAPRPLPGPVPVPDASERPRFTRPEAIRGVYLNAWATGSTRRMADMLALARETEVNTFVLDMKDATGYVSYASGVAAIRESGALGEIRVRDLPGLLRRLEAEGVYPIARIVIVKDPLVSSAHPEWAVQDTAGGVWVDSKDIVWLNLYDRRVWDYHVALAEELVRLGFPEIQWDYVRFPDAPASDMARAVFPGDTLGTRAEAVRAFLGYARERLREVDPEVQVTADVFGVTTTFNRDVGIGQLWERFIDQVDAALPMVYPSHYWTGSYGFRDPNGRPYEVVKRALEDATRRSAAVEGAGRVIPWLQDFTLGAPRYGAAEVRAQIQATYDAGVQEWILWNPGSRYTREALEPDTGFHLEPLVRVAGEIVPVSDRFAALDRAVRAQVVADSLAAAAARALSGAAADTAGGRLRR